MVDKEIPDESELRDILEKTKAEAAKKIGVKREIILPVDDIITVVDLKAELAEKELII